MAMGTNYKSDSPSLHPRLLLTLTKSLSIKKKEFIKTRKEFIQRQNTLLENFMSIRNMENRIGVKSEDLTENIRLVTLSNWSIYDLLMLIGDDPPALNSELRGNIGPQCIQQMTDTLSSVSDDIATLSAQIISRNKCALSTMPNKIGNERNSKINLKASKSKLKDTNDEIDVLNGLLTSTVKNVKAKINHAVYLANLSWLDRDKLFSQIERLEKKLAYKKKVTDAKSEVGDTAAVQSAEDQIQNQELLEQVKKERFARETMKESLYGTENALRLARIRITNLEKSLKENRDELDVTHQKLRGLEQLYRNRETSFDTRSKKLLEMSKNGEVTIETLTKQRNALEIRVRELREEIDSEQSNRMLKENELTELIESLKHEIEEEINRRNTADNKCKVLEAQVKELKLTVTGINETSRRLVEMQQRICVEYVPAKENDPTKRETDLYNELCAAREALAQAEMEQKQSRVDKDCFLESLAKIAEGSNNIEERMASELLEREKKILGLKNTIQEHLKTEEILNKKIAQYEKQLADVKLEAKTLKCYQMFSRDIPYCELQNELLELQMKVSQLNKERSNLLHTVAARSLMLERHERAADLYARITRLRRDLQSMIENSPAALEYSPSEVTCSLSTMCTSAGETWTALQAERARSIMLERTILSQNQHIEREGYIRTQLEKRRANLERQILSLHTVASDMAILNTNNSDTEIGQLTEMNY